MSMTDPQGPSNADRGAPRPGLQFGEAYNYVFRNPNWVPNVLYATLCQLIPVVGPIVMMGYQYEIVEMLHRNPHGEHPNFDFNRFVNYLTRGVWPFLVALVASLVLVPLIAIVAIVMFGALAAAGPRNNDAGPIIVLLIFAAQCLIGLGSALLFALVLPPMQIKAGLAQDFGSAFDFAFIKDFLGKMWLELILGALFVMVSAVVVMFAGALLCCVGVYPAGTLVMLAQAHFKYQYYELYLARGGMPIALKEPQPA